MIKKNKLTKTQIDSIFGSDGKKNCEFILGAHNSKQFPKTNFPEFAFIGASNVGKSSLINALTSQKIAIVSNTPGRTRQINFFLLSQKFMIVDMPGYGYAVAKQKDIENWQKTSFEYFSKRPQLKKVFLLIDPIKGIRESDEEIVNIFNAVGLIFQIVLTKCDKIKDEAVASSIKEIENNAKLWPALHPRIIKSSTKNNLGIDEIKNEIIDMTLSC